MPEGNSGRAGRSPVANRIIGPYVDRHRLHVVLREVGLYEFNEREPARVSR
jgi:hypothetical protein